MIVRILLLVVILVVTPLGVCADEIDGNTQTSYLVWMGAGVMVLNGSVAMANGLSLGAGTADRTNGLYGLVLGSTTMAISAVGLFRAENPQSKQFSFLLGATGLASAVTGALSIKFAGPRGEHVSVSPLFNPFGGRDAAKAGLQLKVTF